MYLHIIDDTALLSYLIKRTNILFPGKHKFYVLSKNGKLKNIEKAENTVLINPATPDLLKVAYELSAFKAVFIHNLCNHKSKIILNSDPKTRFIWCVWGFDYYNTYPQFYTNIFLPFTRLVNLLLFKQSLNAKHLFYKIHPATKFLGIKSHDRYKQEAAKRVEFTVNNLPRDSELFTVINIPEKDRFKGIYYSIEYLAKELNNKKLTLGNDIFIGNSASNSSNHLDIFMQLKKLNLGAKNIFVPLNYGCSRYKTFINFCGRRIFKEKFQPLLKYVPLDEYNKFVLGCNIMIFNHKRAQAIGNIIFGIWAGHKVFLRESNPVYHYLKSLGVMVMSIESELTSENINGLDNETKEKNRLIITQHYSEEQIQQNYSDIFLRIEN